MNLNMGIGNSFLLGCLIVDVVYILFIIIFGVQIKKIIKKSSLKTFNVGTMVGVFWWGGLVLLMAIVLFVSASSGFYEYQRILQNGDHQQHVSTVISSIKQTEPLINQ